MRALSRTQDLVHDIHQIIQEIRNINIIRNISKKDDKYYSYKKKGTKTHQERRGKPQERDNDDKGELSGEENDCNSLSLTHPIDNSCSPEHCDLSQPQTSLQPSQTDPASPEARTPAASSGRSERC